MAKKRPWHWYWYFSCSALWAANLQDIEQDMHLVNDPAHGSCWMPHHAVQFGGHTHQSGLHCIFILLYEAFSLKTAALTPFPTSRRTDPSPGFFSLLPSPHTRSRGVGAHATSARGHWTGPRGAKRGCCVWFVVFFALAYTQYIKGELRRPDDLALHYIYVM